MSKAGAPNPRGYRSPAWEMTPETFDLLKEFDFTYDPSRMGDDRPYVETWERGSILKLPLHWSLDDWPRFGYSIGGGGNVADPAEMFASWSEEYRNARDERRHLVLTIHPEVIGRAYRLAHIEWLLEAIACDGAFGSRRWTRSVYACSHSSPEYLRGAALLLLCGGSVRQGRRLRRGPRCRDRSRARLLTHALSRFRRSRGRPRRSRCTGAGIHPHILVGGRRRDRRDRQRRPAVPTPRCRVERPHRSLRKALIFSLV